MLKEEHEEIQSQSKMKSLMKPKIIAAYILYFSTCYAYYLTDTWLPNFSSIERGFEGGTINLASSMLFLQQYRELYFSVDQ